MKRHPAGILATCVVPWDEDGRFIERLFVDQVERLLRETPQLYIFGTAGEGYAVSDRQFEQVARVFHDAMRAAGAEPMVGLISLSLPTIVERIELARRIGVRLFQISLPSWGPLTDEETRAFFGEVCGRFDDCRFLHYNLLRTKRLIAPEFYGELAEAHPNLVATKNSTDALGRLLDLQRLAPELQHFFNETGYAFARPWGECGLLASVSTIHWGLCRKFAVAGECGDAATLHELHGEIRELTRALLAAAGPDVHIDAAFDKLLWRWHDARFPLRLLPPYRGATEEAFRRFAEDLRTRCPRWAAGE
jgi:dihydrodipicolinate synthase/N-acetylneuraminate lyase